MKRLFNWQIILGIFLFIVSAVVYFIHYLIFRDAHHIFIYLIGDIAFVFIEVLLVTLVIHGLLHHRDKRALLNKLNMVIGAFYSEVGRGLLKMFCDFDIKADEVKEKLSEIKDLPEENFKKLEDYFNQYNCKIVVNKENLGKLKDFLVGKRKFLVNLLENPNLLEHDSFTDLLWGVFHLTEELSHRENFDNLPEKDYEHLSNDIKRAYILLISEWVSYMNHLKDNYPYLFSLAVRTNPFDVKASIEVKE